MDAAIKFIVHLSCFLVFLELIWRGFLFSHAEQFQSLIEKGGSYNTWTFGILSFTTSYILCILVDYLNLKELEIVKSAPFRAFLTYLHASDGLAAFIIGISIYSQSTAGFMVGLLIINKFFLLSLLNRMILAQKKGKDPADNFTQTSKSYLHHVASFLFLTRPEEILLTTLWRTVSMFGHSMLALRGMLQPSTIDSFNWMMAYGRIAYMIFLLSLLAVSPGIRAQFACSAVGHIAYVSVRFGPVFRLGSIYLTEVEKEEWGRLSDSERISMLSSGKYRWLTLELLLLASFIVVLGTLRVQVFTSEVWEVVSQISFTSPLLVPPSF